MERIKIASVLILAILVVAIPVTGLHLVSLNRDAEHAGSAAPRNEQAITEQAKDAPQTEANQAETVKQETDWLEDSRFRLSAHRGTTQSAPENTLEGIQTVIDKGFGAIEIDPRKSADGTFYLMHDDTVSISTDGYGYLSGMTDAQIDALLVKTSSYPEYADKEIHVPTFEEAVKLISKSDLVLNVDGSKGAFNTEEGTEKIINILKKYGMYKRSFLVIGDSSVRSRIIESYPDICLSWCYDPNNSFDADIEKVKGYSRAMLSVDKGYLNSERLDRLNDAGIYYQIYNVNSLDLLDSYLDKGVPMVETDTLVPDSEE